MTDDRPRFHGYDAAIIVLLDCPKDRPKFGMKSVDWGIFNATMEVLGRAGFSVGADPRIQKDYRCLSPTHRYGRCGDLEVKAEIHPAQMSIKFFQNVVRENPNGGEYDFDKLSKMSYLQKLKFISTRRKIAAMLLARGIPDATRPDLKGIEAVMDDRKRSWHWRPGFLEEQPDYNTKDGDGVRMTDGVKRWARSYSGHLIQGVAYYNLNNMWWLMTPDGHLHNEGAYMLFSYDPAKHRRKDHPSPASRVRTHLDRAIKASNFERAIGLRDRLKELTK
jgi:hypothetical protein